MSDYSESEDDPYGCSSGEEFHTTEENKRAAQRRLSSRLSKKPRMVFTDNFSSDEEENFNFKTAKTKKAKKAAPVKVEEPVLLSPEKTNVTEFKNSTTDFTNGSFVISKADVQSYDSSNPPHIWKIDGKVLLQKYQPFTDNGELKYKNSSVYTGWTPSDSDKFYPIRRMQILSNYNSKFVISFDVQHIKEMLNEESD